MTKYAVGFINFFDNDLKVAIVEADNWYGALCKHPSILNEDGTPGDMSWLPQDNIEEALNEAFNADMAFDIKKIE